MLLIILNVYNKYVLSILFLHHKKKQKKKKNEGVYQEDLLIFYIRKITTETRYANDILVSIQTVFSQCCATDRDCQFRPVFRVCVYV